MYNNNTLLSCNSYSLSTGQYQHTRTRWRTMRYATITRTLKAVEANTSNCESMGRYNKHLCGLERFFVHALSLDSCESDMRLPIDKPSLTPPLEGSRSYTCITRKRSSESSPNLTWLCVLPTRIASCNRMRDGKASERGSRFDTIAALLPSRTSTELSAWKN